MRVIGVKAVKLSNVRGFCAELSTAIVVMVASRYGLPVSTTQVRAALQLHSGFPSRSFSLTGLTLDQLGNAAASHILARLPAVSAQCLAQRAQHASLPSTLGCWSPD